jgi:uncharacterized membrane protein YdjX (TVP38/TMEM64 family)
VSASKKAKAPKSIKTTSRIGKKKEESAALRPTLAPSTSAGEGMSKGSKKVVAPVQPVVKKENNWLVNILRVFALLTVIGITVYIYSIRERAEEFAAFGYPGIFLIALMANATVLLPAPGVAVIYAMGSIFNPFWVGLSAGAGGAIGELSGYLAGFSGQAVIERADIYERVTPWIEKYGGWTILVLAAIPNPFFDIAGVAAGAAKMPMWRFLLFCFFGQIIKMSMFAYAGKYSIEWVSNFIH